VALTSFTLLPANILIPCRIISVFVNRVDSANSVSRALSSSPRRNVSRFLTVPFMVAPAGITRPARGGVKSAVVVSNFFEAFFTGNFFLDKMVAVQIDRIRTVVKFDPAGCVRSVDKLRIVDDFLFHVAPLLCTASFLNRSISLASCGVKTFVCVPQDSI
jgi:hypothetical protein